MRYITILTDKGPSRYNYRRIGDIFLNREDAIQYCKQRNNGTFPCWIVFDLTDDGLIVIGDDTKGIMFEDTFSKQLAFSTTFTIDDPQMDKMMFSKFTESCYHDDTSRHKSLLEQKNNILCQFAKSLGYDGLTPEFFWKMREIRDIMWELEVENSPY